VIDPAPSCVRPAEQTEHKGAVSSQAREALCIFFDLESTGLYLPFAEVVEVAAVACVVGSDGAWHLLGDGPHCQGTSSHFHRLIRPSRRMPRTVEKLTGLSNTVLEQRGISFEKAVWGWTAWMHAVVAVANARGISEVWLVGHNAIYYDLPLLLSQGSRHASTHELGRPRPGGAAKHNQTGPGRVLLEGLGVITGVVDTLQLSRRLAAYGLFTPTSHRLGSLYQDIVGRQLSGAHSARGDTLGMLDLCTRPPFHEAFVRALLGGESVAVSMPEALSRARRRMASGPRVTCNESGGEVGRRRSGGGGFRSSSKPPVGGSTKRTSTAALCSAGDMEQKRPCRRSFFPRKSAASCRPSPEAWGRGQKLGSSLEGKHQPPRARGTSPPPLPHLLGAPRAAAATEVGAKADIRTRTPEAQEAEALSGGCGRGNHRGVDDVPASRTRRWMRGVLRTT